MKDKLITTDQGHTQIPPKIPRRFPASTIDRYIYLMRKENDGQIRSVIKFNGKIDDERLARAVRLTLDAEPVLGYQLTEHLCQLYWERQNDQDSIVASSVLEGKDCENRLWDFMAEQMKPANAPRIETRIFRSDHDTLCIKIKHIIADAGGAIDYIRLLARIYRALGANPDYHPQFNLPINRGLGQILKHIGPLSLVRACKSIRLPQSAWGLPVISQDLSGKTFVVRHIDKERFNNIKNYCLERQVSMNDVLITAFYRALFEVLDPKASMKLPIAVTVDLRRHLPLGHTKSICDLSSAFFPVISRRLGDTFENTLAQITGVMKIAKAEQPWLGATLYLQLVFLIPFSLVQRVYQNLRARHYHTNRVYPQLSNIGVIDSQQINFGGNSITEITMFGPVHYPPGLMLSANTYCGTIAFSTGYCHTATNGQIIERFMDLFIRELP